MHYCTMGKLSTPAKANSNNSGIGKYDNIISGSAFKMFIGSGKEKERELRNT